MHNLIILKLGNIDKRPRCGHTAYSLQDIWVKGCGYLVFIITHHGGIRQLTINELATLWYVPLFLQEKLEELDKKILVGSIFVIGAGEEGAPSQ